MTFTQLLELCTNYPAGKGLRKKESGTNGWHDDVLHAADVRNDVGGVVLQEDWRVSSGTVRSLQPRVWVQDQLVEQVDEEIAGFFQFSCKEKR